MWMSWLLMTGIVECRLWPEKEGSSGRWPQGLCPACWISDQLNPGLVHWRRCCWAFAKSGYSCTHVTLQHLVNKTDSREMEAFIESFQWMPGKTASGIRTWFRGDTPSQRVERLYFKSLFWPLQNPLCKLAGTLLCLLYKVFITADQGLLRKIPPRECFRCSQEDKPSSRTLNLNPEGSTMSTTRHRLS